MTTGRRAAILAVALGALMAIPLSLIAGAWMGGAIPFQTELAAACAGAVASVLLWAAGARAVLVVVTVLSSRAGDQHA